MTFECSSIVYGGETLKNKAAVYDCFKNSVVNRNRYYRKHGGFNTRTFVWKSKIFIYFPRPFWLLSTDLSFSFSSVSFPGKRRRPSENVLFRNRRILWATQQSRADPVYFTVSSLLSFPRKVWSVTWKKAKLLSAVIPDLSEFTAFH